MMMMKNDDGDDDENDQARTVFTAQNLLQKGRVLLNLPEPLQVAFQWPA